ncbi:MAG: Holliday junction resolvase RuvX [Burkholderiales bacterium]
MLKGTVLAFDFGLKRVGVAVGELELRMAHPLSTLVTSDREKLLGAIAVLVKEWRPELLVVGLPVHDDGRPHALAPVIDKFVAELKALTKLPVALSNEQYSSATASMALRDAGIAGLKQKAMLDSVAAQEILQGYFDSQLGRREAAAS